MLFQDVHQKRNKQKRVGANDAVNGRVRSRTAPNSPIMPPPGSMRRERARLLHAR